MKIIIATVLALTATTASADHRRHCGTTQHQYWETNYVRVIETRDCQGRMVDWQRIDSTPSHVQHRPRDRARHGHNTNEAMIIGVILGNILAQQNK